MKPLVINDEAADELEEAIRYYENKGPGIGLNLAVEAVKPSSVSNTILNSILFITIRRSKSA